MNILDSLGRLFGGDGDIAKEDEFSVVTKEGAERKYTRVFSTRVLVVKSLLVSNFGAPTGASQRETGLL